MDVHESVGVSPHNRPSTESPSDLRHRIAALEIDLQKAEAAREEAEIHLAKHQREDSEHARHAARNLASFGHSDDIIFVQPEDRDQGLICQLAKGKGTRASVCRLMVRYNLDQFLQRPVLHQWLQNGKLYREAGEQQSSRFELFFDLVFVGMVHQISEAAAEEPTGIGFAKYILKFPPAFSIWFPSFHCLHPGFSTHDPTYRSDLRDIANQFANDDVTQRAYILWIMLLLVGYSNNASAIKFGGTETGVEGEQESLTAESLTSMRWTLGFFVVAKLSKIVLSLVYALFLPMSRQPIFISTINPVVSAVLFFVAMFTSLHVTIVLVTIGITTEHVLRIVGVLLFKTMEILGKKYEKRRQNRNRRNPPWSPTAEHTETPEAEKGPFEGFRTQNSSMTAVDEQAPLENIKVCRKTAAKTTYRFPAINLEHHIDRLGAFVTLVLGEMVVSVFFVTSGSVGLDRESGRAMLGLMIAFNLNWMYFGSPACEHFIHAIRRHWLAGFIFTTLHLPLCMSLLLASSAINRLVTSATLDSELGGGVKWFFGGGLGASVCIMATIGVLHKNLDDEEGLIEHRTSKRRTLSRTVVLGTRYVAGIAMILLPLAEDLSSLQFLAIYVSITSFLVLEETIARIERREQDLDKTESSEEVI
ncbi:hypothetical protein C8R44DRAFT_978325 [Mycena epipterygia]|nr:hypothetical protein C8R44DRAFT_978325 [Mycena epipterygia]